MKHLMILFISILIQTDLIAQVNVSGYLRRDGSYVQPHVRSTADGSPYNNYSFPGNINPYTGVMATGNESTYLERYNKSNRVNNNYRILGF